MGNRRAALAGRLAATAVGLTALLGCSGDAARLETLPTSGDPPDDPEPGDPLWSFRQSPPEPQPALDERFEKLTFHREFYCEGATFGDFDRDGTGDVALGPDWYAGPDFELRHVLWQRPAAPFDVTRYSDCFFEFARDLDGDGWLDVVRVGFPGAGADWLENPRGADAPWTRHAMLPNVDGESPAFVDLVGDERPELVAMTGGRLVWAEADPADPRAPWRVHPLSEPRGYGAFTHGLGVGDVNGDGRPDVLEATGYFLQPESLDGDPLWARTDQAFGVGGAQMVVEDVDADGDGDIVTTLAAHGYGWAWYERGPAGAAPAFIEHVVTPNAPPAADAEVVLHEPHALAMADIDGDGRRDVVTGERFWGHVPETNRDFSAPGRLYWFRHEVTDGQVRFVPRLVDDDSGVGTQVTVGDVNGDGRPDIVVANKKGAFLFRQR